MHPGLPLLVVLTLGALDDSERQTLFARVKHSVVILRQTTLTGERVAHGTGWVVRADGMLVTNSHVAELSHQMEAVFADGHAVPVEGVVYDDPDHDLAVLKISAADLVPLSLSDLAVPVAGSTVYGVGNPLGFDFSFTQGIVAAYRPDGLPKDLQLDEPSKHAVLQLNMLSGAGGSGSPVVDETGRVLGVVRAGMGSSGAMTFAVPVEYVRTLLTPEHLATPLASATTFPWLNVVGSAVALVALLVFFRSLRRGPKGPNRPVRKWSGYEE